MDWLKPVIDWVKGSTAVAVTICVSSALFVFTGLSEYVEKYRPWPVVLFIISAVYLSVRGTEAAGKKAIELFKRKRRERTLRDRRINSLHHLGADEKAIDELVRRNTLRRNGNWFARREAAFTIEEWAWEYLNENPDLLD